MSRLAAVVSCGLAVVGCGGERERPPWDDAAVVGPVSDAGPRQDAGDVAVDAALPDVDAGAVTVTCSAASGPVIVVTRDVGGSTDDLTLLRIPLTFSGAASGISITSVRQLDGAGASVRDWAATGLAPPAGFDGHAVPRDGYPNPTLVFTQTDPALPAELALCDGLVTDRGGTVEITGVTAEAGEFSVRCGLGLDYGGRGPERMPLRCARGVPGWLGNDSTNVTQTTAPIVAALVESIATVHGVGAVPLDAFVSTAGTVSAAASMEGFDPPCSAPVEWSTMGLNHLWRGMTSDDIWSGPVAPGTEETMFWWSQTNSTVPDGTCVVPDVGMPMPPMCTRPMTRLLLRGTSSAGPWEWETGLFMCYRFW